MVFWARCVKGIPSESCPELDICRRCFSGRLLLCKGVGILDENNRDHPSICRTAPTGVPEVKVEGDDIPRLSVTDYKLEHQGHRMHSGFTYILVDFIMEGVSDATPE